MLLNGLSLTEEFDGEQGAPEGFQVIDFDSDLSLSSKDNKEGSDSELEQKEECLLSTFSPEARGTYQDRINAVELLTAEEEVLHGMRVYEWLQMHKVRRPEEWVHDRVGYMESRKILTEGNLRLVVAYVSKSLRRGSPLFNDAVQDGNLGLMRAADKYDPYKCNPSNDDKPFRFTTYATWWIKESVERGRQNNSSDVRIPVHVHKELGKISRAERVLLQRLERDPTPEEIADHLRFSLKKVKWLLKVRQPAGSLDAHLYEEGGGTVHDLTSYDDIWGKPKETIEGDLQKNELGGYLIQLDERQREVLCRRFGLRGYDPARLEDVGIEFGLTRERIRQIEKEALKKIRSMMERSDNGDSSYITVQPKNNCS